MYLDYVGRPHTHLALHQVPSRGSVCGHGFWLAWVAEKAAPSVKYAKLRLPWAIEWRCGHLYMPQHRLLIYQGGRLRLAELPCPQNHTFTHFLRWNSGRPKFLFASDQLANAGASTVCGGTRHSAETMLGMWVCGWRATCFSRVVSAWLAKEIGAR